MSITSFVGPFPTDFAVPTDCSAISSNSIAGFDFKSSCLPDDFNPDTTAYYSPGTGCPSGYTAQKDCTRTNGVQTTVTCCPVRGDIELWCVSEPESLEGPWVSMQCTWSAGDEEKVLLVTSDSTTMGVTMSGGQGINAYGLRMVYESSDLETSTSTPSETAKPETGADVTGGPSETATNDSSSSTASADSADDDAGLSTGAIAAIAVVIPIVLISLGLGLFFFLRRRKQQSSAANAAIAKHDSKYPEQAESTAGSTGYNSPQTSMALQTGTAPQTGTAQDPSSGELYGDMAHSPYHTSPPQELPAQSYVVELPADTPPRPPPKSPPYSAAAEVTPSPMSEDGKSHEYFHRG